MNQIAVGDSSGWTVLDGQAIAAPFKRAAAFFQFSPNPTVTEKVEIVLAGTPAQITAALTALEGVRLRARAYTQGAYSSPQYLRFQQAVGGAYYYSPIADLTFDSNPAGYIHHQKGSYVVRMHYTRPNYFDGDPTELPLTGKSGSDVTGGLEIVNHIDSHLTDGNTALIKPVDFSTQLPAPLRLEIENTTAAGQVLDILIGSYHHPTVDAHRQFYGLCPDDIAGGTNYVNAAAINENYRSKTWTSSNWEPIFNFPIDTANTQLLDGRWYRPVIHLFAAHAYTDLYMRVYFRRGTDILVIYDPIYADPDHQYMVFPPVQIPPNPLLGETAPHHVEVTIYALKEDGTAATIALDQILLLPLDHAIFFDGFFNMGQDDVLIYDAFRGLSNVRFSAAGSETIAHLVAGGPLHLYPGEFTRLFFLLVNTSHQIDIARTAKISAYYRPRVRLL